MNELPDIAFRDIREYPRHLLQIHGQGVSVPVTYRKTWDDGFGARGWKVDATIGDPEIIASTRETGQTINTSVFVHDVLDHFLSGFGVSGHRSEAMALIQLEKRTGSDPLPDYVQMVREDVIRGRVNGEPLMSFLPGKLTHVLPPDTHFDDKALMRLLADRFGEDGLEAILVRHFFALGNAGRMHAIKSWSAIGLDPDWQTEIGEALQALLEQTDLRVEDNAVTELKGSIGIDNRCVAFVAKEGYAALHEYR